MDTHPEGYFQIYLWIPGYSLLMDWQQKKKNKTREPENDFLFINGRNRKVRREQLTSTLLQCWSTSSIQKTVQKKINY